MQSLHLHLSLININLVTGRQCSLCKPFVQMFSFSTWQHKTLITLLGFACTVCTSTKKIVVFTCENKQISVISKGNFGFSSWKNFNYGRVIHRCTSVRSHPLTSNLADMICLSCHC